ncbi:MAG: hypothetical protein AAF567_07595 [Actinomycetota bacterium]
MSGPKPFEGEAIPADDRPFDLSPISTEDLPDTPVRDRNLAAAAWREAPTELLAVGEDLGIGPERTAYKRRIGPWLLWRAGPARGPARYIAIDARDLARHHTFFLDGEKNDTGVGPSGETHTRFRTWKEDLLGRADPDTERD